MPLTGKLQLLATLTLPRHGASAILRIRLLLRLGQYRSSPMLTLCIKKSTKRLLRRPLLTLKAEVALLWKDQTANMEPAGPALGPGAVLTGMKNCRHGRAICYEPPLIGGL